MRRLKLSGHKGYCGIDTTTMTIGEVNETDRHPFSSTLEDFERVKLERASVDAIYSFHAI